MTPPVPGKQFCTIGELVQTRTRLLHGNPFWRNESGGKSAVCGLAKSAGCSGPVLSPQNHVLSLMGQVWSMIAGN